jgi:hypothetical protein
MLLFAVFLARIADDVTTSHSLGYQKEKPKLESMYCVMPGTEILVVDEAGVAAAWPEEFVTNSDVEVDGELAGRSEIGLGACAELGLGCGVLTT